MSLGLLLPAGLLALAGLLLPLLLHLVRRSELVPTDFAALRWLSARARPRRRLRFNQRRLLAVRLLLIAAIALLLAQPVLTGWPTGRDWLLVLPGADPAAAAAIDATNALEQRWLAPGFPALDSALPAPGPVASLLRELDAKLAPERALTVIVPTELAGLDGARLRLSRPVDWRIADGAAAPAEASRPPPAASLDLWLAYAPERAAELRFLRAAAAVDVTADATAGPSDRSEASATGPVLKIYGEIALPTSLESVEWPGFGSRRLIWLSDQALPPAVVNWLAAGGQMLRIGTADPAADGAPITVWRGTVSGAEVRAYAHGRGRLLALGTRLIPARLPELLQPDFPELLHDWLASAAPAPARATAASHAPDTDLAAYPPPARDLGQWLALLIALLFLAERWLASAPRRLN